MEARKGWIAGLIFILVLISVPVWYFTRGSDVEPGQVKDTPRDHLPQYPAHVDHTHLFDGMAFETGPDVTKACLECHEEAADQIMKTPHWRWESDPIQLPGRPEPVTVGKKHSINNFCIGIQGNWSSCTSCHIGYGWKDANFDFNDPTLIDCLSCHDNSGLYAKGKAGNPAKGSDLLAAAKSVGKPTRQNCGGCHFKGGGGDAVKHGDLDESLYYPSDELDVHMGRHNLECVDCHRTKDHVIGGRSISVSLDDKNQIACTDCHQPNLHADARINEHVDAVACETCHIPYVAKRHATKVHWDWSKAGDPTREENVHEYLKIKGEFVYRKGLEPEYYWFNGLADRYIRGDPVNSDGPTPLNHPKGDIRDPKAKIWPFKVHRATQPYDTVNDYLLIPVTSGEGGFWHDFDWDKALRLGVQTSGLAYSGFYDFAQTVMWWPQSHMVAPKEEALQCQSCHSENGRLDWKALGYPGDPIRWGGRNAVQPLDGLTAQTGAE